MQDKTQSIVSQYLSVLEKRAKYGIAMPLSMLPGTKNEIKEAIKSALTSADKVEERDKLKMGFITLSEFIPDEVLKKVNQEWKDVAEAGCEGSEESGVTAETDVMGDVVEVQKSIADEGAKLAQELSEFLK
jgi:hypothetical protein